MENIPALQREKHNLGVEARKILDLCKAENRQPTTEEQAKLEKIWADGETLESTITREASTQRLEMASVKIDSTEPEKRERKSAGRQFIESEAYRNMVERRIWNTDPVEIRDIIASALYDAGSGVSVTPQIVPGIVGVPQQPLRIRDLFNVAATTSNSIAFVRETLFTNNAAAVKESIEGSEQEKPESVKTFESEVVPVQTLAHWIPATRQIIADATGLEAFINNQLIYGLKTEEEYELLFGSGTAPHLTGVCPLATSYDPTLPAQMGVTNITNIDHIRAAIYQVRAALYPADAVVLNPFDWAAIELAKNTTGSYIWVVVTEGGVSRLWRLPVVESDTMPQGHFLVGAFKLGAQLWDREQASIRIAEQHADFFIKNLVAILCEERLALTVYRPQAFIYGTFSEYGS